MHAECVLNFPLPKESAHSLMPSQVRTGCMTGVTGETWCYPCRVAPYVTVHPPPPHPKQHKLVPSALNATNPQHRDERGSVFSQVRWKLIILIVTTFTFTTSSACLSKTDRERERRLQLGAAGQKGCERSHVCPHERERTVQVIVTFEERGHGRCSV